MPEVYSRRLRFALSDYEATKSYLRVVQGVFKVPEVCPRWMKFALGSYKVADVGLW
jgi:hypothetical protein